MSGRDQPLYSGGPDFIPHIIGQINLYRLLSNYTKKPGFYATLAQRRQDRIKYRGNSREVRAHYNNLAKRASSLDGRGSDSKPCRVQRACAVSYRGRHEGHPPTQSTSVANNVVGTSTGFVCMYVWASHIAEYGSTG